MNTTQIESSPLPASPTERIASIDVLRGFAVLGILAINIWLFGQPFEVGSDPRLVGTYEGADTLAFFGSWIFFEGSQRAIFSMLFGASTLLMLSKLFDGSRAPLAKQIYYRRTFLLIGIGLVDAYVLLWYGDILFFYGIVGLFLYFVREWSPRKLLTVAGVVLTSLALLNFAGTWADQHYGPTAAAATEKQKRGESITEDESIAMQVVSGLPTGKPSEVELASEISDRSSGYVDAFVPNFYSAVEMQLVFGLLSIFWDVFALMLIGMALYKWRIFDASRSLQTYVLMSVLGLGIGLSVNTWETFDAVAHDYSNTQLYASYDVGRLGTAIGIVGLIMLVCKLGLMSKIQNVFAAVGRMALTNYIVQTIVCNVFFIGFGFFGGLRIHELYYVVGVVWLLQLVYSPLWLSKFKFGPLEWVWRTLTYGQRISIRGNS